MSIREVVFAALLFAAAGSVSYGVSLVSRPAAFIVGGVLCAALSWLCLADDAAESGRSSSGEPG